MTPDNRTQKLNRLTLAFAKAVAAQGGSNDNLLVSPYNALTALSMAAAGAAGETREEMAQTLFGIGAKALDSEIDGFMSLNNDILAAKNPGITLNSANAIWTNASNTKIDKKFVTMVKKKYDVDISAEKFSDPKTVEKINKWAEKNTNGLIKEVLTKLEPNARAVLASALYFKGDWTLPFDKKMTQDAPFTKDDGVQVGTAMMQQNFRKGYAGYHKGSDYEAVTLNYGTRGTMVLSLIRPSDAKVSAAQWLSGQKAGAAWLDLDQYGRDVKVNLSLPRMDIEQKHDLVPVLKSMGIRAAFDTKAANFSKMVPSNDVYISKVTHDVSFKTDETGSEAAAVTTVEMATRGISMDKIANVRFDRSYVMALMDRATGAVLFVGAVNKPNNDLKTAKAPQQRSLRR